MGPTPFTNPVSRRRLLAGGAGLAGSLALSGCIGGSPTPTGASSSVVGDPTLPLTLQSDLSDALPKAAMEALVKGYTKNKLTMNTVATEQFRAQLSSYLTSGNPPDVITWLAGSVLSETQRFMEWEKQRDTVLPGSVVA